MMDITQKYLEQHPDIVIKCPKCESQDVVVGEDEDGYFWVYECNKCGYRNNRK